MAPKKGSIHNPSGKGGFGDHPENRSSGHWDKRHSMSYQYRYLMSLSVEEFEAFGRRKKAEMTVAERSAYLKIRDLIKRPKNEDETTVATLPIAIEVENRISGKAVQPTTGDITVTSQAISPDDIERLEKALGTVKDLKRTIRNKKGYKDSLQITVSPI